MSGEIHGRPSATELLDATIAFLRDQLSPELEGSARHQVRIAVHALEIVFRELEMRPEHDAAHRTRLEALGFNTDRELADAIRSGAQPDSETLRRILVDDTRDRLEVANPRWLPEVP